MDNQYLKKINKVDSAFLKKKRLTLKSMVRTVMKLIKLFGLKNDLKVLKNSI